MMMEENNNNNIPQVSHSKDGPKITPTNTTITAIVTTTTTQSSSNDKSRFAATVDDGGGIDCSGKYCKSCMAGLIADCVALCCCPCAVLHCFAWAFVKAPWVVGRRCLGLGKKKNKKKDKKVVKRKCCKEGYAYEDDDDDDVVLQRNRKRNLRVDTNVVGEMDSVTVNAAFEAEKVWLELYQIGHLDFGRVSSSHD